MELKSIIYINPVHRKGKVNISPHKGKVHKWLKMLLRQRIEVVRKKSLNMFAANQISDL